MTPEGYLLDPQITIPQNATGITINQAGQVSVTIFGQTQPTSSGRFSSRAS